MCVCVCVAELCIDNAVNIFHMTSYISCNAISFI